jgi:hypothetical protein
MTQQERAAEMVARIDRVTSNLKPEGEIAQNPVVMRLFADMRALCRDLQHIPISGGILPDSGMEAAGRRIKDKRNADLGDQGLVNAMKQFLTDL